jgi:ribonuclease HIII
MLVPFHTLPDSARVWVYASERVLSEQEQILVGQKAEHFLDTWQSHQADVRSSFEIRENRFLILAVDENFNGISGCGIDKSLHFVQELEVELGILLTNKTNVVFEDKGIQVVLPFIQIKTAISQGIISTKSLYYNTLVATMAELKFNFKINVTEGWVKKYFLTTTSN